MNEVIGGKIVKENETGEAKKFRQGIIEDIENANDIAKEKGIKNWYVDYTPEFPQI